MKYIVTRTSTCGESKPCDEAVEETVTLIDERNIDDPMKNKFIGKRWYTEEKYFNHRVENGHIKRDFKEKRWTIEINSLEDLNKLEEKYGKLIITKPIWTCYDIPYEIEIYDTWRE